MSASAVDALGIDAGGSSTRWVLLSPEGEVRGGGRVGPISGIDLGALPSPGQPLVQPSQAPGAATGEPMPGASASAGSAWERLHELVAACLGVGAPGRVVAGFTGLEAGSPQAKAIGALLAAELGLPTGSVTILSDTVTAYLSAFRPGSGILVYSGTGSIAVHLTSGGDMLRAGGHGYLLDDAGGGYWIGREALKLVLRRSDEAGGPAGGALADAIYHDLGGSDWTTVRSAVYQGGRSRLAALTRVVAQLASRGDPDARAILAAAALELARLALVLSGRLGQILPVALAGGVAGCGPALAQPLREALGAQVPFSVATRAPVEAAADLARRLAKGEINLPPAWG